MTITGAEHDSERSLWWVGGEAVAWREAFVLWLCGIDSPRPPEATWRIHLIGRDTLSLPRLTTRWPEQRRDAPCVVWAIPSSGIVDLVQRIDHVRHTRPGYCHLTAGLASPVERMFLSEVGTAAHVQYPCDWDDCRMLFEVR